VEPGPVEPPPKEKPPAPAGLSPAEIRGLIQQEVEAASRKNMDELAPLQSRRRLLLEFSGGLMTKYRQAQQSATGDQPEGGRRAPNGFALSRVWINVFAAYSDIVESEVELAYNGDYSLLDQDILEVPRAIIVYNRPFSQFVPGGVFRDSFLFGVDGHFWRQSRASESMALGQRAFHQDEVAQIRYTTRMADNFYLIGAFSDGGILGFGQVDDSNNYPLLQDDKTRYVRGLGDKREISRYLQFEVGGGLIFDFNTSSFLRNNAHFSPEAWTAQNTNYFNVLAWFSVDRLSFNEVSLVEGLMRIPFKGGSQDSPGGYISRRKWRMGANMDFAFRVAGSDLVVQGHYVHGEDGRLVRDAWGVEVRYTFELPRIPFFLRITPMFRYSELVTNNDDNPLDITDPFAHPLRVSTGAVPPFSLADGAGFTANRREFMLGVNLTLARNVIVGFEIVFNEEDFNQVRNVPGDVPNTFYMLRIGAEF
jgi:hypothetical protein